MDEEFLKYNKEEAQHSQYDPSRRRRVKPTQATHNEDTVAEKRGNVRKRPSYQTRVNDDTFDAQIVTESALSSYGQTTEPAPSYNENNQFATNQPSVSYVTSQPANQYYDYSSQQSAGSREEHSEYTTLPVQEYFTEISREKVEDYNVDARQKNMNVVTSIPLEDLYVKTDGNYYDRATTIESIITTTPSPITTTTAAPQPTTQSLQVVSSTLRSHKMRPLRYGNATRPRFSIKDYKSRLDYKNRLSSTTEVAPTTVGEALTRVSHIKQRTSSAKNQQAQQPLTGDNVRETTGRYKYVSRVNYRTTTTTSSPGAAREYERFSEETASSTTEKSNKFVPKRRPISSNVYRSRIASTTNSPTRTQINSEINIRQSSTRPENVYSSSIRKRPAVKSRLQSHKEHVVATTYPDSKQQEEPTEMSAEETSFYSTMTTAASSSTTRFVGNEIVSEKRETSSLDSHPAKLGVQEGKNEGRVELASWNDEVKTTSLDTTTTNDEDHGRVISDNGQPNQSRVEKPEEVDSKIDTSREGESEIVETTTKFDSPSDEEELFARASQSVADLTSSASALYDKPGMFKAVSPESRLVSSHFKITTDEPTLPIEAFFQEFSKKN